MSRLDVISAAARRPRALVFSSGGLQVDAADWARPTPLAATFETDLNNLELASFSLNVTDMVMQYQGSSVGLRFKLVADPELLSFGFAGSDFCNVRIDAVTITEAHTASACGILQGFTRELMAQAGSQQGDAISDVDAANLLGAVTPIMGALGCRQG